MLECAHAAQGEDLRLDICSVSKKKNKFGEKTKVDLGISSLFTAPSYK